MKTTNKERFRTNANTLIDLNDTLGSAIMKLSKGNPGAVSVLAGIANRPDIDPDSGLGALGCLLNLDSLGLYGHKIWLLYKDVCCQNIVHTVAMLRA